MQTKTAKREIWELKQMQSLPLSAKKQISLNRIEQWFSYWDGDVYVSFSGGKDSTVLMDLCAEFCKRKGYTLHALFFDTGLEYPEIKAFAKQYIAYLQDKHGIEIDLQVRRPKMMFHEVIKRYGYPILSKEIADCVNQARKCLERNDGKYNYRLLKMRGLAVDKDGKRSKFNNKKYEPLLYTDFILGGDCCRVIKKTPAKTYGKETGYKPITGQMAEESMLRKEQWLLNGCNGYDMKKPISNPMSFWLNQDILQYIKEEELPICSVYGDIVCEQMQQIAIMEEERCVLTTSGVDRTGCIFCGFGLHLEKEPTRFQRLKQSHPKLYNYCIGGGQHNEEGIWQPNEKGLGLGYVFDQINKIYGENFIKYK